MKKYLLTFSLFGMFSSLAFAQETEQKKHFENEDRKFKDWSISAFAGANAVQNADLVSWAGGWFTPGYDLQFQVNKQITHAFALSLQYQYGNTRQKGLVDDDYISQYRGYAWGKTEYHGLSILGDLNISNIGRRVDNTSQFRWALHAYAGAGFLGFEAKRNFWKGQGSDQFVQMTKQTLADKSFYSQVGAGLRHKLSQSIDLELKAMYVMTGDEEFDAGGKPWPGKWTAADTEEGRDDNMLTLSLGVHYKIGKNEEALQWHPPVVAVAPLIAEKGFKCTDKDQDGVCDEWDKCLDTPPGIRVDGAGCSLDSDGDGVPDSEDKCPTIPGPPTNMGCPEKLVQISGDEIALLLSSTIEGVDFEYNSDKIREASFGKLNNAAEVLKANPNYKFYVEGHTDAAGGADYNQKLSERRAASVIRYLANKGVDTSRLTPVGKGKSDLKHVECNPVTNCPAWKNLENRRVIFKEIKD